jgi:hypothetical protein
MSRVALVSFLSGCLLSLVGCAPSPEEVCKHMETLEAGMGSGMCTFKLQQQKDTKREQYNKLAPCILEAKDKAAYNACLALQK